MKTLCVLACWSVWGVLGFGGTPSASQSDEQEVKRAIIDSIAWALEKDVDRLYEVFPDDERLLIWWISSSRGPGGFEGLKQNVENVWLKPEFKATKADFRDIQVHFSRDGQMAWFSCMLDDCGLWGEHEFRMLNVRNTGVLEKVDGKWRIIQTHASWPIDQIPDDVWQQLVQARTRKEEKTE